MAKKSGSFGLSPLAPVFEPTVPIPQEILQKPTVKPSNHIPPGWNIVEKKKKPFQSRNFRRLPHSTAELPLNVNQKQCTPSHQVGATDTLLKCVASHPVLCLMRGVPGCGKSTLARLLAGKRGQIFSADDYFFTANTYRFNPNQLEAAHTSCFQRAIHAIEAAVSPVVIDNTNIQKWEMSRYVKVALRHGYEVYFVEPETKWRYDVKACFRKNQHSVDKQAIERMLSNFNPDINLASFAESETKPHPVAVRSASDLPATAHAVPSLNSTDEDCIELSEERATWGDEPWEEPKASTKSSLLGSVGRDWSLPSNLTGAWTQEEEAEEEAVVFEETFDAATQVDEVALLKASLTGRCGPVGTGSEVWRSHSERRRKAIGKFTAEAGVEANFESNDSSSLAALFPKVPPADVEHVLETCQGDVEWAANILLDSSYEFETAADEGDTSGVEEDPTHSSTSCSDEDESGGFVIMDLGPTMADQLQSMFGFIQDDELPAEFLDAPMLRVRLPLDFAASFYRLWVESQYDRKDLDDSVLDDEEDFPSLSNQQDSALARALQEIQDEEFARQLAAGNNAPLMMDHSNSMATKIKLQQLQQMYPMVPDQALLEVFQGTNYHMDATIDSLSFQFGPGLNVNRTIREVPSSSTSLETTMNDDNLVEIDVSDVTYQKAREEAVQHGRKRAEAMKRARAEYRKGPLGQNVAHYFIEEARKHDEKMKAANAKAAELILAFRRRQDPPSVLDLHGLHVQEAIKALAFFLRQFEVSEKTINNTPRRNGPPVVKIITGSGKHSSYRGPKLRPAVLAYLKQRDYKFEEDGGMFRVWCK